MSNSCSLDYSIQEVEFREEYVAYYIVTPLYFIIGTLTRSICLIAFYKQYKKEKAYVYQIFYSFSDLSEIIAVTLCVTTKNNLSGLRMPGVDWYKKDYFLMWYAAHLASPSYNGFVTTSLLLTLSMAIDRLLAVAKPFWYKTFNHNRNQLIAIITCFTLGLSTSIFDIFRYNVQSAGDHFKIVVNVDYVKTTTAVALSMVRDAVRIIGDLAVIICNIALVICHNSNTREARNSFNENPQRSAKRRSTQKTLLLLTISQSIFVTADITMCNVYYIMVYIDPNFTGCFGKIMAPMLDLTVQLAGILEFFALFAISKQFRRTILNCLQCGKRGRKDSDQIQMITA